MPAKSQAQQKFFGVVKGIQQGTGKGTGKAKKAAKSMSKKDVDDFASTKHKGLPKKVKRETKVRNLILKMVREIMSEEKLTEKAKRDYKAEYKKFQSSTKSKKYRAELNKYNRQKGTYGNGDKKDASHKGGKIVGFEEQSKNRGRKEKSRLKKEGKLTPEQQLREIIKSVIKESFYTIGAGGLSKIEEGVVHIAVNSPYYLGASMDPDLIIVTKVDDTWIEYVKPIWDNKKKLKIEKPIGESLITDGTNTWLKTYGKYSENKQYADTMKKNLNGQKGPNNGKVKPSDYDRYVLTIKGKKGSGDVYGIAKNWGVTGRWNGKSGEDTEMELELYKIYIPLLKKKYSKELTIAKQRKGELR
tara:strand:- start:1445 stop:2518 length:1074 start_codon:yes stop_codon:yes gene_type:complete